MPSFDKGAYNLRSRYSLLATSQTTLYAAPGKLSPAQIDSMIACLQARIIGPGEITKEECAAYYEGYNSEVCADYQ